MATHYDVYVCVQGQHDGSSAAVAIQEAMRAFIGDQGLWDQVYRGAYVKMVTRFASYAPRASTKFQGLGRVYDYRPIHITGRECKAPGSRYVRGHKCPVNAFCMNCEDPREWLCAWLLWLDTPILCLAAALVYLACISLHAEHEGCAGG